jgi:hypothetical protein
MGPGYWMDRVTRGQLGFGSTALLVFVGCGSDPRQPFGGAGAAAMDDADLQSIPALQIPAESWEPASAAEDPFVEFSEGRLRCTPFAFRLEATWLEVTTTDCNYATLVYRLPLDVAPGDLITGEVAWATLASLEPAIGTLAFATERDEVLWTHEVSIPGQADIVQVRFAFVRAASAGSALYFHVRNHGYNSWQLSPLTLTEPSG